MKDFIDFTKKRILLCTVILAGIFFSLRFLLNLLNLEYRQWIFYVSALIIVVGVVAGIIQLTNKIKLRWLKILSTTILIVMLLISIPYAYILFAFSFRSEHIVIKNKYKLVAYVDGFKHTSVNYYDYKNPFIRSKQLRLYEYYGRGGFDPIENKYGYTYDVVNYTWYDDYDNPIQL